MATQPSQPPLAMQGLGCQALDLEGRAQGQRGPHLLPGHVLIHEVLGLNVAIGLVKVPVSLLVEGQRDERHPAFSCIRPQQC